MYKRYSFCIMPTLKPRGKFRRAATAIGRGFARTGKAIVQGTKVVIGRQLTRKQIEMAHKGVTLYHGAVGVMWDGKAASGMTRFTVRKDGNILIMKDFSENKQGRTATQKNVDKYYLYTPDGKLISREVLKTKGGQKRGRGVEYNPPGRFIGKQMKR